jgi:phospholipid/cholesterol/gamma-HCH transport system ATP-binding protein
VSRDPERPGDARSGDARSGDARSGDARPGGGRDAAPAAPPDRRAADRRGAGARDAAVRTAIRSELAGDAPGDLLARAARDTAVEHAVIELEDVSLAFDHPILENVSFAAYEGETIVVLGESGTGKSTILKLILRLLVADSGRVLIEGEDVNPLSFAQALAVRAKMGMVFQGAALFDSMTVYENVAYPLREHTDLSDDEIEARVRQKLEFVDLEPDRVMRQLPSALSGGMRKRVGVARGIANDPKIMLYDEPTSGLDPLTTGTITKLIMKLQRELGVTSVVVSHDIRSAFRMASRVALLADRHIRFLGTPEEMAASEDDYIRDFLGGF